jgi:protein TonB
LLTRSIVSVVLIITMRCLTLDKREVHMRRDIFGDVIDPRSVTGGKSWISIGMAMVVEVTAIAVLVIAPLMVVGFIPKPPSMLAFTTVPPPPSPPPPPPPAASTPRPPVDDLEMRAPVEPPAAITPEPERISAGFEHGIEGSTIVGDSLTIETPPPPPPAPDLPRRVGGVIRQPQKVRDVPPVYPPMAIAARVEGTVIIEAVIGPDGAVKNATLLRSIPLLDQAALDAVRQWQFTPTLLNGQPVPVIMTVTVRFSLQK